MTITGVTMGLHSLNKLRESRGKIERLISCPVRRRDVGKGRNAHLAGRLPYFTFGSELVEGSSLTPPTIN